MARIGASRHKWPAIAMIVLGVAVCAMTYRLWGRDSLVGVLHAAQGARELAVVAPAESIPQGLALPKASLHANVPGDEIRFENRHSAEAAVHVGEHYDVVGLPFLVEVDSIQPPTPVPAYYRLQVDTPRGNRNIPLVVGDTIDIGQEHLRVAALRPWVGLLPDGAGAPMTAFTYRESNKAESVQVMLADGDWKEIDSHASARFAWVKSEEDAHAFCADLPAPVSAARWAVRDGDHLVWLDSLLPGTGLDLTDGRSVTLAAFHPASEAKPPEIEVELRKGAQSEHIVAKANAYTETSLVCFDYPATGPLIVSVAAWQEGRAVMTWAENGQVQAPVELEAGQALPLESSTSLRLDQVLSEARPIATNLYDEVLFESGGREIRVHEGETVRMGDLMLSLSKHAPIALARYGVTLLDSDGAALVKLQLRPGHRSRYKEWVFRPAPILAQYPDVAVIGVYLAGNRFTLIPGAFLLLAGSAWFVVAAKSR